MKKIKLENTDETLYYEKLDCGLEIYMIPNKNINKFYLTLNTRFGSINTKFKYNNKEYDMPKGIAHYLEHLAFNMEEGSVFEYYSKIGSSINAFTTYDLTSYNVMSNNRFKENLEYLLEYVYTPYFTKELFQSEKGVIEEEVKMYKDDPGMTIVNGTLNNLFVNDYDKEALAKDGFDKENWQYNYVYWDGKPFVLTTTTLDSGDVTNANITYRKMWAFQGSSKINSWSYLEKNNTIGGLNPSGSGYEQMSASVAMQKTHMSNTSTATGRNGGKTWYNQWVNVFKNHPKVVTITWWNEWGGERQANGTNYCPTTGACFTDNYNQEYSRDIEPMKGGHGDKYYKWLKQYITAYKANSAVPQLYD